MSYVLNEEIHKAYAGEYIQRAYVGNELVFIYKNPVIYILDIDANGNFTSEYGTKHTIHTEDIEYGLSCTGYTPPVKTGFNFVGWRSDNSATSAVFGDNPSANNDKYMGHNEVELYALHKRTIKLSFNNGGGTGTMNPDSKTQYYNNGNYNIGNANGIEFTLPQNTFTRTNYNFIGWSVNGVSKNPNDKIQLSSNTTVTALWKENKWISPVFDIENYGDYDSKYPNTVEQGKEYDKVKIATLDLTNYNKMQVYIKQFTTHSEVVAAHSQGSHAIIYIDGDKVLNATTTRTDFLHYDDNSFEWYISNKDIYYESDHPIYRDPTLGSGYDPEKNPIVKIKKYNDLGYIDISGYKGTKTLYWTRKWVNNACVITGVQITLYNE